MYRVNTEPSLFKTIKAAKKFAIQLGIWYYISTKNGIVYTQDDEIFKKIKGWKMIPECNTQRRHYYTELNPSGVPEYDIIENDTIPWWNYRIVLPVITFLIVLSLFVI